MTAVGIPATVVLLASVALFIAGSAVTYRMARKAAPNGMGPWALTVVFGLLSGVATVQLGINAFLTVL